MKKWVGWHITGWAVIFCLFASPAFLIGFNRRIFYVLLLLLLHIPLFYVNIYLILPRWIRSRNAGRLLMSWLGSIVLYTILSVLFDHLLHVFEKGGDLRLEVLNTFFRNCFFVGGLLFISTTYKSILDWFNHERLKQQLENERLKAELSFLKSQINPHFLFNSLNNIYVLAYQQSAKTAEVVLKLSEMMQYMLYESADDYISLSKELHYIEQLIAMQQLRMNEPMSLEFSVAGSPENCTIAPMILISFIENLFKHGVLNNRDDPAVIRLNADRDGLTFYSRNEIGHHKKDPRGGIGLTNVKRRLDLLYAGRHQLKIEEDETHYSVHLTIELSRT